VKACEELGIVHERIPVRTPNMNAHIESFHAILEEECYSQNEFESFIDVYATVSQYMDYYNERRRHGSLGYKAPSQFHEAFLRNNAKGICSADYTYRILSCAAQFHCNVWNTSSGRFVDTRILMDGVQYPPGLESRHVSAYGDATGNNTGFAVVQPTPGSHTFKVQWRVTAGTGGAASRRLYVYQFKR
jgi:hypothetical protein